VGNDLPQVTEEEITNWEAELTNDEGFQLSPSAASHSLHNMSKAILKLIAEVRRLRHEGREAVADWITANNYATGHGDSIEDLLVELEGQIKKR
jgi:hypothetical protein